MTAEFGLFCLIITFCISLLQSSYFVGSKFSQAIASIMPAANWLMAFAVTLSLASLVLLRVESDFSVANVVTHSNLTLPMLYKVVGTWGNHEGSMLVWLLIMVVFAALLAQRIAYDRAVVVPALAVQSMLIAGTCGFILFTSNPFARVFPPPVDGRALNPLLQDIGLAIHPPVLYLGYVGFSIVFSLAVGALIAGKAGSAWGRLVHPWIVFSWAALTAGIGLGSWWAYRELGWGGWWFWDPVENASLLPWLVGIALMHSNIVLIKRSSMARWVVLLAILTFAMSMIGTFLVRSGALTSVHSFANDPARGLYILAFIVVSVGAALVVYAIRAGVLDSENGASPFSREGMMVVNNVFLLCACGIVLLGTIYPLIADWLGMRALSVGAPYYNATVLPLMVLPVICAAMAPHLSWQKAFARQLRQLIPALMAMLVALLLVLAYAKTHIVWAMIGFGLAAWLGFASMMILLRKKKAVVWPVAIAHFGVALLIAGITAEGLWKTSKETWMQQGQTIHVAGYTLTLNEVAQQQRSNHEAAVAYFDLTKDEQVIRQLAPEYRRYAIRDVTTSESSIHAGLWGDFYTVIGEQSEDKKRISTRIYYVPLISFIWLGFAFMALGAIVSFCRSKKRYADGTATI